MQRKYTAMRHIARSGKSHGSWSLIGCKTIATLEHISILMRSPSTVFVEIHGLYIISCRRIRTSSLLRNFTYYYWSKKVAFAKSKYSGMCRTFDRNFQQCQKWSLLRIEKLLYKSLVVALNFAATNLFQMEYACVIPAASFIAF
jgi:hypothetical protein